MRRISNYAVRSGCQERQKLQNTMSAIWPEFVLRSSDRALEPDVSEPLDGLANIAARLFDTPFARISLATPSAQIVVGRAGADIALPADSGSLFDHAAQSADGLVVIDTQNDPRFIDQPAIIATGLRFFAGMPLLGGNGLALGTICVMDTAPRVPLPAARLDELRTLAKAAIALLEHGRLADVGSGGQTMPRQDSQALTGGFASLADALPQLVWSTRSDGSNDYISQQWAHFTGAPASAGFGAGWLDFVHPDDACAAGDAWAGAVRSGQPYATEFRLRQADGSYRWMLARALPVSDACGRITRWIGTCTDIDARVRSGDLMEFMSRELSHRIKNLFAVVQGLIAMALRKHPGMAQVSKSLEARMVALGRAHDLIRPRIADGAILRSQTTLRQLIEIVTLPFVEDDPLRLEIIGDDAVVDERAATPLALFCHEMAMNSARFGALSLPQGRLRIAIAVADTVTVDWQETGGPTIATPPKPEFGLSLIKLGIERQLGGSLTLDWRREGLHAVARIAAGQLNAGDDSALR
jgi:PAS domain S-box-containing protein